MIRKLDPSIQGYTDTYLDFDEHEGFPMPQTDADYDRYYQGLNIYADDEKDQQAQ